MTLLRAAPAAAAVTLGDRSNEGSSVAVFNGRLYLAYIGTNRDNTLNVTSSADGQSFSTSQVGGNSNFSPAITAYNGRLYLAWVAKDSFRIQIASSSDGVNFSAPVPTTFVARSGPALGVANGQLYLAWTTGSAAGTGGVTVATSTDGVTFSTNTTINVQGNGFPPALIGVGNTMYLAFTSSAQDLFLYSATSGFSFSALGLVATGVNVGPGLGTQAGELYLAWADGQTPVYSVYSLSVSNPLASLIDHQALAQSTVRSPSIAAFNGAVFYVWTGTNRNRNINIDRVRF